MRLALISDVHSNLHALQEVEKAIDRDDIDLVVCAGDIVGYCAFPNECCRIVQDIADHIVLGNHDIAAVSGIVTTMNPYATEAARWTSKKLDQSSREFLRSIETAKRFISDDVAIALYHGSPRSVNEYLFEKDLNEYIFGQETAEVIVLGHTHVPFAKKLGRRLVVNPGAVGQPRDGNRRASYAVLDTVSRECDIKRLEYDIESAASAIEAAGLPAMLADRLHEGR
jgi:putative phosphoesterase